MDDILDLGGVKDRQAIDLATSRNRRIPNARRAERAPQSLQAARDFVTRKHPSARVRSLSATYNCIGLAFATRRTWVDTAHVKMILDDDGYAPIEERDVQPGDLAVYRDREGNVTHVGIVISHVPDVEAAIWRTRVLSQWGADGEYFHDLADVDEWLGKFEQFYTERRTL